MKERRLRYFRYFRRVLGLVICERVDLQCSFGYIIFEKPLTYPREISMQMIRYHSIELKRKLEL